jgi:hypothetical protein
MTTDMTTTEKNMTNSQESAEILPKFGLVGGRDAQDRAVDTEGLLFLSRSSSCAPSQLALVLCSNVSVQDRWRSRCIRSPAWYHSGGEE